MRFRKLGKGEGLKMNTNEFEKTLDSIVGEIENLEAHHKSRLAVRGGPGTHSKIQDSLRQAKKHAMQALEAFQGE